MDQIIEICHESESYPQNLSDNEHLEYVLSSYFQKLNDHRSRLFSNEQDSQVICRDLDYAGRAFWNTTIRTVKSLNSHLGLEPRANTLDPRCRFIFVHAPQSRAKLKISKDMLTRLLSYLQVMPEFVDLLLPLGERSIAQDFFSNCFYQQTRLDKNAHGLRVPERAWSGQDFQICYSLKSVERSEGQFEWPWSIRHCATQHVFDVRNVRSSWVIVKGNRVLQDRIASATSRRAPPEFSSYGTVGTALSAAFSTHLIMIDCSAENWRWYINFLEDKFQEMSEGAISTDADIPMSPKEIEDVFALVPRTNTQNIKQTRRSRVFSFRSAAEKTNTTPPVAEVVPLQQFQMTKSGKKQPLPPGISTASSEVPTSPVVQHDIYGQRRFRFRDLQDIQDSEESANETILVLKLNTSICKQIADFYRSLFENEELPRTVLDECQESMRRFERRVKGVMSHMESQILRVEGLLRLIADRKTLLYGLLEFQNTRSNKLLASESHKSTRNMERVTQEMSLIARETKTETVSMKIITLVTLFFLPGTFVATLMSTDIIRWDSGTKKYKPGALHVYLLICLPFMAATFIFWGAYQWLERRKERQAKAESNPA
ncbi:MAG: hypothetical protein Q9204_002553 [Flavoplaca sp. TL-2023a]